MWSLFKKKKSDFDIAPGTIESFEQEGEKLDPLVFSNGKTQADIVKEIIECVEKGEKIIFIKGVCGTGKSAIALNLARNFKKTSIVVPIKSLQEQYEFDYTKSKFLLKKDKSKLKISVIKGRQNFPCHFLGGNADAEDLPCKIEIREKNKDRIMRFIEQNPDVEKTDFSSLEDVRRMSIAPACPYWSPLLPADINNKILNKAKKLKYNSVSGKEYCFYQRQNGCGYYDQYDSYINSDVLIFNSQKYILEMLMGRKPKTDLDVIDECDDFLDNFSNEKSINLNRLNLALSNLYPDSLEKRQIQKEIIHLINSLIYDEKEIDVEKIFNTNFIKLIEKISENPYLAEDEEDNYYNKALEISREFEPFLDETYVSFAKKQEEMQRSLFGSNLFGKKQETAFLTLVTINLAKRFGELLEKTQTLILMSGTLHSEQVLKEIFGLKKFKIIDAETRLPGTIVKYRTGLEKNCKYENFKQGFVTRENYLKALSCCIENAKKPILVHVNSFEDLPTEYEKIEFKLGNIITKDKIKELQERSNEYIDNFKKGKIDILFTTKCSRGMDFPGEMCNSIIITKYPYPNLQNLFWKILRKEQPDKFTEFYWDKARRDLIQKIARGVRFKGDHVILLSPDSRVLEADLR